MRALILTTDDGVFIYVYGIRQNTGRSVLVDCCAVPACIFRTLVSLTMDWCRLVVGKKQRGGKIMYEFKCRFLDPLQGLVYLLSIVSCYAFLMT